MIITSDIYRISYFVLEGFQILDTQTIKRDRQTIVEFKLSGANEETEQEIERKFKSGRAVINLRNYLDRLFNLRSIMYEMKEETREEKKNTCKNFGEYYAKRTQKEDRRF